MREMLAGLDRRRGGVPADDVRGRAKVNKAHRPAMRRTRPDPPLAETEVRRAAVTVFGARAAVRPAGSIRRGVAVPSARSARQGQAQCSWSVTIRWCPGFAEVARDLQAVG